MNNTPINNIDTQKSIEFSVKHFNHLKTLNNIQKSHLFTSISLELLATACCLITNKVYLKELLACLNAQQYQWLLADIDKKKRLKPSPWFITRTQKMIIYLQTMFTEVINDIDEFHLIANAGTKTTEVYDDFPEEFGSTCTDSINADGKILFSEHALVKQMDHVGEKDSAKFQRVLQTGALKTLYYPTQKNLHSLEALAQHYPNFSVVINIIKSTIQIHLLGNAPFSLPIINLQGEPGCGKTCFVKALANTLKVEFFMLNVASMNSRFEIVGGNRQYGDADVGAIGQIMCLEAKTFQPLILIDELCMARDSSSDSVIQPLYGLFDREQRKGFKEHYLGIELDLSGTLIITTTNNFEQLKPALKSRLVNIEIKPPTQKQMHSIVSTIYNELLTELALTPYFKNELPKTVLALLANTSPRFAKEEIRLAIGQACSRANKNTKITLDVNDFDTTKFNLEKPSLLRLKKVGKLH